MTTAPKRPIPDYLRWTFRIRDIAQRSGLSESEIRRAIYAGELPARKYRGRVWLIDPVEAMEWIKRGGDRVVE